MEAFYVALGCHQEKRDALSPFLLMKKQDLSLNDRNQDESRMLHYETEMAKTWDRKSKEMHV